MVATEACPFFIQQAVQMNYEKANLEKEPRPPFEKQTNKDKTTSNTPPIIEPERGYKKEEGFCLAKSFYIVVSGGEKREKDYLKIVTNQDHFRRLKIEFIADPKNLNPKGLLEIARIKKEQYKKSQDRENPDKIFLLSDVDHFYCELQDIIEMCAKEQLHLIISTPCFEIWLYYGEFSEPPTDFNKPDVKRKISSAFKTYLNCKKSGGINPKLAIYDIETAIKNARENYSVDEFGIPILFSTQMYLLAEELLPLIKRELKDCDSTRKKERREHLNRKLQTHT